VVVVLIRWLGRRIERHSRRFSRWFWWSWAYVSVALVRGVNKLALMPLKSIMKEMKGGIGSMSRRSFDTSRLYSHSRARSSSVVLDGDTHLKVDSLIQQSCWASMPPELLRDVISRLESSEGVWPCRRHVVACAAVCSSWREITKELVKTPEQSGKLTFPISLKQVRIERGPFYCRRWYLFRLASSLTL
jgi:hypothetical protein